MISLIVCSVSELLFEQFSLSVANSIGVEFELVRVENQFSQRSISMAYNYGSFQAKSEILVFVHEDVIFHTNNWGRILIDYFDTLQNPGVLGVAGSSYLPISPSDWWVSDQQYVHTNFLSNTKGGACVGGVLNRVGEQEPKKVFSLDGMFLALKKSVWEEFPFDESLEGFHGYDTSICYMVSQKYQNYFVPGILLEHFSKGYPNEIWLKNTVSANEFVLPFILESKKNGVFDNSLEIKSYRLFLRQLMKFSRSTSYSFSKAWYYLWQVFKYTKNVKILFFFLIYCLRFSILSIQK